MLDDERQRANKQYSERAGPMIRRNRALWATILTLWLSAPAAAGTLYKCVGGADQPTNYTSKPIPGMSCKAMGYKGGSTRGHSPIAFGSGSAAVDSSSNGFATSATAPVPTAPNPSFAGSVTIPTAVGAPAIAKIGAAPTQAGAGSGGGAAHVVFRTSDASESLVAPVIPAGVHAQVTRGAMYKYTRNGVNTYTNVPPPGSAGGITGNIRIPGIAINFIVSGPTRSAVGVVRSPHGFKTIPPKPEFGEVIWKEKLVSGKV